MPRSERLYLSDIVDATSTIERFIGGRSRADFLADDMLRRAVLQLLMEIGEAAAHVSPQFRSRHPEIDWRRIVAFRNLAVHTYFAIDWTLVWSAATEHAPKLAQQLAAILARQKPESTSPDGVKG